MSWSLVIPAQGIKIHSADGAKIQKFIADEISYFNRLGISDQNIQFAQNGYGSLTLTNNAVQELSKISSEIGSGKTHALEQYINDANARRILVGASASGKRVEDLKQRSANGGAILAAILSEKWSRLSHPQGRELVEVLRATALGNPANFAFDDLLSASEIQKTSKTANEKSVEAADRLGQFIEEKTKLISELEVLYRQKLTIQEPAVSWENTAKRKTKVWIGWLILFATMVILPILIAVIFWENVSGAIGKITASANGGFSISGLAIVSVPALFYAWLLKNISRVFIQNLNLADDASHRRALALTYMGLLQDDKHPATDQDRAIILNALFRPIPPQTNDEGPPAGLIELISKK